MRRLALLAVSLMILPASAAHAQFGGNISYAQGGGKARAQQEERERHVVTKDEMPPDGRVFVDATVLANVAADRYIARFAIAREAPTVDECGRKMDAIVAALIQSLGALGIPRDDIDVDFVGQTRNYAYKVEESLARETLVGFELRKTLSVRYQDPALLDKIVVAAANNEVYDLIKVDYIVDDPKAVRERLAQEAAQVIRRKAARHAELLDIRLIPPAQVVAERAGAYEPSAMYDSYNAHESEGVSIPPEARNLTIQSARKSRTFFHNPLDSDDFDAVINPVPLAPTVQYTLYLRVMYTVAASSP